MTIPRVLVSVMLIILAMSHQAGAVPPGGDKLEMSFEVILNPVDDNPLTGCESSAKVDVKGQDWWISFATVQPLAEKGWEKSNNDIRCGSGSFDRSSLDFKGSGGVHYLFAGLSIVARFHPSALIPDKILRLNITLSLQKFTGFGADGEPVYVKSVEKRTFFFLEGGDAFIPLLIADSKENEALGIYEIFIKTALKRERAEQANAYGVILVTSGTQGGELFLDGGTIGNISSGGEISLRNVPVGLREVKLHNSDTDIRKVVRVTANRTVLVDLNLPEPKKKPLLYRLEPLGKNTQGYDEYLREQDRAVVVKIPAGEFLMGNKDTERSPHEHRVYVSDFMMDKTGVTWAQYKRFAEATGVPLPAQEPYWGIHDDHPAVFVTWENAKTYCEWTGARLPTEAEREKAARGTDGRKYPWGNEEPDAQRAVFRRNWGKEATAAVATHPAGASPYGLQDMGGNVWEWCSDWYDDDYYNVSPYTDPKGPSSGNAHVVRGGSWDSRPDVLSASCRSWGHRGYREGDFGFRCAMNIPLRISSDPGFKQY
jgi:formylglycine-generating enzyme required for sulfatase activity